VQHRPGWTEAPVDEFRREVERFRDHSEATAGGWVVDGNYETKLGGVLDAADCVVWLDYPRHVVMGRVVRRTLARLLDRRELWNGNRQRWRGLLSRVPDDNIVLWAWTQHQAYREQYAAACTRACRPWVRLRSPRQAARWLTRLPR
jgi:adenylate kinase family enzyme